MAPDSGGLTTPGALQGAPAPSPESRDRGVDLDFVLFLGDGSACGEILNQDLGRLGAPAARPPGPPAASGRFRRPLEAMKEKEVHPKQVKVRAGGSRARRVRGPPSAATVIAARACPSVAQTVAVVLVVLVRRSCLQREAAADSGCVGRVCGEGLAARHMEARRGDVPQEE